MYVCSSPPGLYTSLKQKLTEKKREKKFVHRSRFLCTNPYQKIKAYKRNTHKEEEEWQVAFIYRTKPAKEEKKQTKL